MRLIHWGLVVFLVVLAHVAFAADQPDAAWAPVTQAEDAWFGHLEAAPAIYVLKVPESAASTTAEDKWRFHVVELREKAKSNRAWHEYWKSQLELAGELGAAYNTALTGLPTTPDRDADRTRLTDRRGTIQAWQRLCKAKTENQDTFLKAIEQEKDAYEKRLDAATAAAPDAGPTSKDAADGPVFDAHEPTRYQKYKSVLRDLQQRQSLQMAKKREVSADSEFAGNLLEAARALLEAQTADHKLAVQEAQIVTAQVAASADDRPWHARWEIIATRTAAKLPVLAQVIANQQERVGSLTAERAYLEAMVEIKGERAGDLEAQIAAHKKTVWSALLYTVADVALQNGLVILAFLFGAWLAMRIIRWIGKVLIRRASDSSDATNTEAEKTAGTLVTVFSGLARAAVYILTGFLLLDTLGVNVKPLMGAFAIFGLAISFGSQNLVKDVVNGFFILLENQVSVGDVVEAAGKSGSVEKVTLRRLVLRDIHGTAHNIPHGQISALSNSTQSWARAVVHIGVAYGSDLRRIYEIFNQVGQAMIDDPAWRPIMEEPPTVVGVTELADSAINLRLWCKVAPSQQWAVERELYVRLHEACNENGIEIPFPQRVVEFRNAPPIQT